MFVAPSWDQLNHNGLIVARYLPGTATPCPGLVPGSLLRVYAWEPFHDEVIQSSGAAKRSREDNDDSARSASSSSGPLRWTSRQDRATAHVSDDEKSSSSSSDDESPPPAVASRKVYRQERALLVRAFKREMRFSRRVFRRDLRSNFDEEIRAGQEGKEDVFDPSAEDNEAEAWENYEFDGMMQFDIDLANQFF